MPTRTDPNFPSQTLRPATRYLTLCIWSLVIQILITTGCSNSSGIERSISQQPEIEPASPYADFLIVNNPKLGSRLQIVDARSVKIGTMVKAQLTLRSTLQTTQSLQYKFSWLDIHGMEIEARSQNWNPLTLYGMETKNVQGVSPTPSANTFRLIVREQEIIQ